MSGNAPNAPSQTPDIVEPTNDYLGFRCVKCGLRFPIILLDIGAMPRDKPMRIGAHGPIPGDCKHCGHSDHYAIDKLIRFSE